MFEESDRHLRYELKADDDEFLNESELECFLAKFKKASPKKEPLANKEPNLAKPKQSND